MFLTNAPACSVAQFVACTRSISDESVYAVPLCSAAGAELTASTDPRRRGEVEWQRSRLIGDILVLDDMVADE